MSGKMLSQTNPYLKDTAKARRNRVRSIASSVAIETGESIAVVEEKVKRLHAARKRLTLA